MKKLLSLLLLLFPFLSAYAEDDILYDETGLTTRMIQTKEVPYALSPDIPLQSYTLDLNYIEDYSLSSDTTKFYSLRVNIPSKRPHSLPRHTKILLKGEDGKVFELSTDDENDLSDCKSFEAFGNDQWHICYSFYLSEKQILALAVIDVKKLRFQTPWNSSVEDVDESMFENFGFSSMLYHLYEIIQRHLKISENIYDGF